MCSMWMQLLYDPASGIESLYNPQKAMAYGSRATDP